MLRITNRRHWGSAFLLAVVMTAQGTAAQDSKAGGDALDPLRSCRAMTIDTERLACFDRVSSALVRASEEGELRLIDRQEVRKTRRTLFGFALPDLGIFGRGDKAREKDADDEVRILNTTIASSRSTMDGLEITTAEGAIWLIPSPPRRLMTPRPGQPVELRSGSLSSYFIRINGQGGVKGRRVG